MAVKPEAKLPLVSMVLPALKRLSPAQLTAFRNDVVFLTRADNTINLFEYAVHRLVLKRLLPRWKRRRKRGKSTLRSRKFFRRVRPCSPRSHVPARAMMPWPRGRLRSALKS